MLEIGEYLLPAPNCNNSTTGGYSAFTEGLDGSYYFACRDAAQIVRTDPCFKQLSLYKTKLVYGSICYDIKERCYWGWSASERAKIIQLNERFEEIGSLNISPICGNVSGIVASLVQDYVYISAGSRLYRIPKDAGSRPMEVRNYQNYTIRGINLCNNGSSKTEGFLIGLSGNGSGRQNVDSVLAATRQDGTIIKKVFVRCIQNAEDFLYTRDGRLLFLLPPRSWNQGARRCRVSEWEVNCNEVLCEPICIDGYIDTSLPTKFYHCYLNGIVGDQGNKRLIRGDDMMDTFSFGGQGSANLPGKVATKHYKCSDNVNSEIMFDYQDNNNNFSGYTGGYMPPPPPPPPPPAPPEERLRQLCDAVKDIAENCCSCGECPPPCPQPCPPPRPSTNGCNDLIESIALVEAAIAHILNAEGEKLQLIIARSCSTSEILSVNEAVRSTIVAATHLEQVLYEKLNAMKFCCKCCQPEYCDEEPYYE